MENGHHVPWLFFNATTGKYYRNQIHAKGLLESCLRQMGLSTVLQTIDFAHVGDMRPLLASVTPLPMISN